MRGVVLSLVLLLAGREAASDNLALLIRDSNFTHARYERAIELVEQQLEVLRDVTSLVEHNSSPAWQRHLGGQKPSADAVVTVSLTGQDLLRLDQATGLEVQTIGHPNSIKRLRGYGLVTSRELLRLQVEVATLRGEPSAVLDSLAAQLEAATMTLNDFIADDHWAD